MEKQFVLTGFADEISADTTAQLEGLQKLGVTHIEPRNIDGKNIIKLTDEEVAAFKAKLEKYGISVSSIGSPIGKIKITDDFDAHFEEFKRTVEIAKLLDTGYIRMFSFFYPKNTDVHTHRAAVLARLEILLELAEKRGLTLCHENEKAIYGEAPEDCLDLMKHFDGRMKSVLDMGNFAFCQKDPMKGYEYLAPYIEYIHIKDAFYDTRIVPAGQGEGKVFEILSAYNKYTDKDTFLTMEPHLTVFDGLNKLSNMDDIKVQNAYATPEEAFDAAVAALRGILERI